MQTSQGSAYPGMCLALDHPFVVMDAIPRIQRVLFSLWGPEGPL